MVYCKPRIDDMSGRGLEREILAPGGSSEVVGQVWADLDRLLREGIARLAEAKGIDISNLTPLQRKRLEISVLEELGRRKKTESLRLAEAMAGRDNTGLEISVARGVIEITTIRPDCQTGQVLRLADDQKFMLATIASLTDVLTRRYLDPWVTCDELMAVSSYSENQWRNHGLRILEAAGVLEKRATGYRLACDPEEVARIVGSNERKHQLMVPGFDGWFDRSPFLVEKYHLTILQGILKLSGQPGNGYLNTEALALEIDLSRDWVRDVLPQIEEAGLIARSGSRYRYAEMHLYLMQMIVNSQHHPLTVRVRWEEPVIRRPVNGLGGVAPAFRLEVSSQLEPEFPQVSFARSGVEVTDAETLLSQRQQLLGEIDTILMAELIQRTIFNSRGERVYSGYLPTVSEITDARLLGILDLLGLGPKELERLDQLVSQLKGTRTLSSVITTLAEGKLALKDLIDEIKSRIASLVYESPVSREEVREMRYREIIDELLSAVPAEESVVPSVLKVLKVEVRSPRKVVQKGDILETYGRVMGSCVEKEVRIACAQPSISEGFMTPEAFFNHHRTLSGKSDLIPWGALITAGLAYTEKEGAGHERLNLAGALVAAVYLNSSVHDRMMASCSTEKRTLEAISRYIAHWFKEKGKDKGLSANEVKYIQVCLESFARVGIVCECEKCR